MIAVLNPNCAARMAATYPPGPLPITTTSYAMMILNLQLNKIERSKAKGSNCLLTSNAFCPQSAPFFCAAKLNQKRQTRIKRNGSKRTGIGY
jgi:hypothetical protein